MNRGQNRGLPLGHGDILSPKRGDGTPSRPRIAALAWNGLFTISVVAAVWFDANWLTYSVVVFVWLMLGIYVFVYASPKIQRYPNPLPSWFTVVQDVFVVACFIYAGWYLTAAVYVASCLVLAALERPSGHLLR